MKVTVDRELLERAAQILESLPTSLFNMNQAGQIHTTSGDLRAALASPAPDKLWLWKNFVNGIPEYWAFDNAFPVHLDCDDPQTIGEPCGYALLKPSRKGRNDVSDEEVLRRAIAAIAKQPTEPGWLPISEAPKDGTEILLTNGVDVSSGQWFFEDHGTCDQDGAPNGDERDAGWMDWSGGMQPDPTHWQPLPPAQGTEPVKESLTPEPLITREQHFALREAFAIGAADSYFAIHPTHDNDVGRMLFERGFARGFDSHERALETAHGIGKKK